MRTFVVAAALLAASMAPAAAQPAQRCSSETFPVGGQTVAVTVCAGAPEGNSVAVTETFKGVSGSFTHPTSIDVLPGAAVSRSIDDVSLATIGLAYTMHLTLAYRAAGVGIEHALLLPGAIPLK